MSKKNWIKVKRGLLEPKHRDALGVRIWLYLYILDRADWDSGMIPNWTDQSAADDMGMSVRTLTKQRQELENAGYISARQSLHCQVITIHNWTNPREYTGEVYNPNEKSKIHGTQKRVPSNGHGAQNRVPYGLSKPRTIYPNPHIKNSQWDVPPSLQSLEFEEAFYLFLEHRKEIKKKVTQRAGEMLIRKLSKYSVDTAIAMLHQSVENSWTGVFEIKGKEHKEPVGLKGYSHA